MDDWKARLKADPTAKLLEADNPSVRYWTLRDILDKPETDPQVGAARWAIMQKGWVPAILERQREAEYQAARDRFYHAKYAGLVWQLIILAECAAAADAQIREQCEYLFTHSQAREGGGFAMQTAVKTGGGRPREVVPCLTGNMVWSLIRLGYLEDPRLQAGIGWLTDHVHASDGEALAADPRFTHEACWGRHTCFFAAVKSMKALAAIPAARRTDAVRVGIARYAEYFLRHHIYKRSHDLSRIAKPGWLKFGFPVMYQTDALEILDILTGLGIRDTRMEEAVEFVRGKQEESGYWRAENRANNEKFLVPLAQGERDEWVTLRALRMLKRWDAP